MTERSTLERKRLSDLHQIASQLGIKQYRKYRKPELAEMIYQVATEQAASQQNETATNGGAASTATQEAPVATDAPNGAATETPVAPVDGFGEADTNLATTEQVERQRQERGRRDRKNGRQDRRQEQRGDRDGKGGEENVQSGILDVLPDGFGFLRTGGYSQSKGDVYVSTSQIKRFNLRRGDHVVGQIRPAREGEKYPAMVRIETVNGEEPQKGHRRQNFDDLPPLSPQARLRLEWRPNDIAPRVMDLTPPIGKGQRGLIAYPPKAGKT